MAARKNYTAAQIINGLRRAEVGLANGKSMKEVIRDLGVSEQTYPSLPTYVRHGARKELE